MGPKSKCPQTGRPVSRISIPLVCLDLPDVLQRMGWAGYIAGSLSFPPVLGQATACYAGRRALK
eukprot:6282008-Amphidinium_carterae.1